MKVKALRRYNQPDLSDFVVHFVKRLGKESSEVPAEIHSMSAQERFVAILSEERILAFPPFGYDIGVPMVCFTECTPAGIKSLIGCRYRPLGIAFEKALLFQNGGGPAFYVRGDEWEFVKDLPDQLRGRATRLWPGRDARDDKWELHDHTLDTRSEWTHEREWRVHGKGDPPAFRFSLSEIAFFIIPAREFLGGVISGLAIEYSRVNPPTVVASNLGEIIDVPRVYMENRELIDEQGIWIR